MIFLEWAKINGLISEISSVALLHPYNLPSMLQVLVEGLLSDIDTRARNGSTQESFL